MEIKIFVLAILFCLKSASAATNIVFNYNTNAILDCSSLTGTVTFLVNGVALTAYTDKYVLSDTGKLTIVKLKKAEMSNIYSCTSSGGGSITFANQVSPYFYQVDALSVTYFEEQAAELTCHLIVGSENSQTNTFSWRHENSNTAITTGGRFTVVSGTRHTLLKIENLKTTDKGYYYCSVTNTFGTATRQTKLRVKSILAPLYPFLGFLGEVVVLSTVLGCSWYFNKQKTDKIEIEKTNDNHDDEDQKMPQEYGTIESSKEEETKKKQEKEERTKKQPVDTKANKTVLPPPPPVEKPVKKPRLNPFNF